MILPLRRPTSGLLGHGRGPRRKAFVPRVDPCETRLLMSASGGRLSAARHPAHVAAHVRRPATHAKAVKASQAQQGGRNVIVFVADGLRPGSVNSTDAPTLNAL